MRQTPTNDDVISTREAAERLGVALRTVQLWVEAGVLPAWKTAGGHRRIARAAVEQLLAERQAAIAGTGHAPVPVAQTVAPRRLCVMVLEHEPDPSRALAQLIGSWDLPLELITARDGFDALLRIGAQRPDLLVSDLDLPGMDGIRMIRALCEFGRQGSDLQIVVVTALGPQDIANRGGLPEHVRVFAHPVPAAELEALVRQRVAAHAPRPRGASLRPGRGPMT